MVPSFFWLFPFLPPFHIYHLATLLEDFMNHVRKLINADLSGAINIKLFEQTHSLLVREPFAH